MFEILAVILFLLVVFSLFVLLPILFVGGWLSSYSNLPSKRLPALYAREVSRNGGHAEVERERLVRVEEGWRIIGRVLGAGCCAVGLALTFPTPAGVVFGVIGYRLLKPIRQGMRGACAYRSTGAEDEPPYSSGDIGDS